MVVAQMQESEGLVPNALVVWRRVNAKGDLQNEQFLFAASCLYSTEIRDVQHSVDKHRDPQIWYGKRNVQTR